ncbi:MAG: patatin-like phospholipase family protein [Hyphomicrobium sp.]
MVEGFADKLWLSAYRAVLAAALAAVCLSGCATPAARNGIISAALAEQATIPGLESVRFWADEVPKDPIAEIRRRTQNMPAPGQDARRIAGRPLIETLALSGGGADGAFGAGVLAGWTARGDRPEFEVVTGVSAGAIIAPFAFLGPKHDPDLQVIWTQYKQSEVITTQFLPGLLGGSALTDTTPLAGLIAKYIDRPMLDEIASEYRRGRILMVLTTNLDAQRPVVWNMGEISLDPSPESVDLFRKVILASAAIPAAFPPVKIDVVANGKRYDELHVDGGTTRELFVVPVQAPFKAFDALYPAPPMRRIYIIKNGKVVPEQEIVPESTLKIAARSIATLIKSQNWSELYRIYRLANDGGADFNFMAVPQTFEYKTKEIYDPKYQSALYEQGIAAGRSGAWLKAPPGQTPITPLASRPSKATPTKPQPAKPVTTKPGPMANRRDAIGERPSSSVQGNWTASITSN